MHPQDGATGLSVPEVPVETTVMAAPGPGDIAGRAASLLRLRAVEGQRHKDADPALMGPLGRPQHPDALVQVSSKIPGPPFQPLSRGSWSSTRGICFIPGDSRHVFTEIHKPLSAYS